MQRVMKIALLMLAVVLTAFLSLTGKFYNKRLYSIINHSAEGSCNFEDIRLYDNGETNQTKGMLQICDGVKWTAVCDYRWRQEYSVALCNDLGHNNSSMFLLSISLNCILSIIIAPLTVSNNGSWSTIGYVAKSTSLYSTPTCYSNNNTIAKCLTNSSSYVTYSYYRHIYCNTARDTLYIQCNFDMGKLVFT